MGGNVILRAGKRLKQRVLRSLLVFLLTVNHLVVALGIPIPVVELATGGKSGEPFPCINCPCGCRTADQCWRHCCCFTLSQRLAWAKDHGVTPPSYVVEAAREEAARENGSRAADDRDHCKPCCGHCNKAAAGRTAENSGSKPGGCGFVVAIKALECQGGSLSNLKTFPAVVPSPAAFVAEPLLRLCMLTIPGPILRAIFTDVPVPPPRG